LDAVERCDLFLGIITTEYGSGKDGDGLSILHQEIKRAIERKKPRWLLAHDHVIYARQLLRKLGYKTPELRRKLQLRDKANALTDLRVIDMYEDATLDREPLVERQGNWVQKFNSDEDALLFTVSQFSRFQEVERFLKENLANPARILVKASQARGTQK